jgi:hypothetical protein
MKTPVHKSAITICSLNNQKLTSSEALLKTRPRQAQALALGWETPDTVWVVDDHWADRAIDVEAGDLIFVYGQPSSEGDCVEHVLDTEEGRLLRARQPGIGRLEEGSDWSAFVRVSRPGFVGRSLYRHREEADDD